ncbi:cyclic nucleotide-binding domain-containing protein [Paramaledivibacter caminithermalis]|jgi:CRP-like cAMP-binding protein|uniref:cAMP-binding domain of CRP or a regulatory subunit of cAMP-dependent protein kinases n=1 Tax=Paramaledivibacter caminithermalis (strain DSM 15212 / CIP 107654 / DViRD3) TaxID=1121301 RepID=A0A1M6P7L8_PARC5|nr:cyclic nucleotide-binding domain-containing protein [Paramaledivibacter caminithermalis]SHK03987.1 cAMP-binding domain of CRP or a regulatory subunit of cAMP-dependent protein kinases [Paramaledivibacter caminithermalis DSM 15212]
MKRFKNHNNLHSYIKKYNIDDIFQKNIFSSMELHTFNRGEHICRSHEKINYFYFLVEGKMKVYTLLKNGRSLLLRFYTPLQVIGDVELLSCNFTTCNVEAITDVECIGIPIKLLRQEAQEDIIFLQFICKSLSDKLSNSSYWNAVNLLYPLENRLASYILAIANSDEDYAVPFNEIKTNNLTDMAELLGTSYRHLNRTLNNLCKKNIIKKEKNSLIILNREGLEKLAGDLYK